MTSDDKKERLELRDRYYKHLVKRCSPIARRRKGETKEDNEQDIAVEVLQYLDDYFTNLTDEEFRQEKQWADSLDDEKLKDEFQRAVPNEKGGTKPALFPDLYGKVDNKFRTRDNHLKERDKCERSFSQFVNKEAGREACHSASEKAGDLTLEEAYKNEMLEILGGVDWLRSAPDDTIDIIQKLLSTYRQERQNKPKWKPNVRRHLSDKERNRWRNEIQKYLQEELKKLGITPEGLRQRRDEEDQDDD